MKSLVKEGCDVIVYDNLSAGFEEPLEKIRQSFNSQVDPKYGDFLFIKGDLADKEKLTSIVTGYQIDAVVHLAARLDVAESMEKPDLYYKENYLNSVNLLDVVVQAGIKKFILASTCAVYGNPTYTPIDEKHPVNPVSPYPETKWEFEKYLKLTKGVKYVVFRFFNVGGCDPDGLIGKGYAQRQDLLENIYRVALGQKNNLEIYGEDYDTPDGSAIRDFIHVQDIVKANLLALKYLDRSDVVNELFNLGSEKGFSVKETIKEAQEVIGKEIETKICPRRAGDASISFASSKKAREVLGWNQDYSDLETIINTDWKWRTKNPQGYHN